MTTTVYEFFIIDQKNGKWIESACKLGRTDSGYACLISVDILRVHLRYEAVYPTFSPEDYQSTQSCG